MGAVLTFSAECCTMRDKKIEGVYTLDEPKWEVEDLTDDSMSCSSRASSFSNVPSMASEEERAILLNGLCREASLTMRGPALEFAPDGWLCTRISRPSTSTVDTLQGADTDACEDPACSVAEWIAHITKYPSCSTFNSKEAGRHDNSAGVQGTASTVPAWMAHIGKLFFPTANINGADRHVLLDK
eukprot:GEMP01067644.1.p1 GENE.GEMP01067644.1~~GEMP01067644.1.p1  ORF type:complete len:185 (+),score=43.58 GEMP01067644.1:286-840(+)